MYDITCDNCKEEYQVEDLMGKCKCGSVTFTIDDETSSCCGASIIDEIGLCSDCKEHCI